MLDLAIAQAMWEGDMFLACSPSFSDEWKTLTVDMGKSFGSLTSDAICPAALCAKPLTKQHVAIVHVAGPPTFGALRFRILVLGRELYDHLHDPFAIDERFIPNWNERGSLPDLEWPRQPLPPRTIAQLDAVLKHGDGPFLLGASQTLVDGGKIMLQRAEPEPKLLRDLWALLPDSTRRSVWPATYAFSNELGFDIVVLPSVPETGTPGYLTEDQARDYPDSRYERHLQIAIEAGDQRFLDKLLSRRSSAETLRLAVLIIVLGVTAVVVGGMLVKLGVF